MVAVVIRRSRGISKPACDTSWGIEGVNTSEVIKIFVKMEIMTRERKTFTRYCPKHGAPLVTFR